MEKWNREKMDAVQREVARRATTDAEFRAKFLADPAKAIEEVAGIPVPKEYRIRVIEADPAYEATFFLPPMQSTAVDDESLDAVAGGMPCAAYSLPCLANDLCGAEARK